MTTARRLQLLFTADREPSGRSPACALKCGGCACARGRRNPELSPGAHRQPPFHRRRHELGRVLLDEVSRAGHRHEREVLLQPVPRAREARSACSAWSSRPWNISTGIFTFGSSGRAARPRRTPLG